MSLQLPKNIMTLQVANLSQPGSPLFGSRHCCTNLEDENEDDSINNVEIFMKMTLVLPPPLQGDKGSGRERKRKDPMVPSQITTGKRMHFFTRRLRFPITA